MTAVHSSFARLLVAAGWETGVGKRINLELVSRVSGRHCDGDGKVSQVPGEPS